MSLNKVLIIQARMSSTRLPGKTIMPLAGKPLIYRMIERLKKCKKIDQIVIATSTSKKDEVIKEVADQLNVEIFQGSLLNVRDRYFQASKKIWCRLYFKNFWQTIEFRIILKLIG